MGTITLKLPDYMIARITKLAADNDSDTHHFLNSMISVRVGEMSGGHKTETLGPAVKKKSGGS